MKLWTLLLGIIVIFAIVCSPVLAISKSELISQYKTGYSQELPLPSPTPAPQIPSWIVIPTPTLVYPTEEVRYGSISVTSEPPGAMVFLDDNKLSRGTSPIIFNGVSAEWYPCVGCIGYLGNHHIKVTMAGYQDYTTHVIVKEGTTTPVSAILIPISVRDPLPIPPPTSKTGTGTLLVTSNPMGAKVYLDGEYKGVIPDPAARIRPSLADYLTLTGIPAGLHQLKVTKEGFWDYSASVVVNGGETTTVIAYLFSPSLPRFDSAGGPKKYFFYPELTPSATDLPSKGKPNIYLYSDQDLTAQVRLAPEYAITVSEPVYQPGKGWRAEIRNGSLNGNGDFLFYEALGSDFEWQKEEGFAIRAASREQDMAFMLGQYGFNEKETLEFIDYWASHLTEDVDFVFYPQETAAVNQDMPLYITPKPDHVMRIWFCAEPFVSAPGPVVNPETIIREGFYIVEWGVIIDDEYWINHSPASSEVVL